MLNIIASQIGVPSAASFDPLSISGCKLWLDAADTSTISLSGSDVTQWDDKSGNGYNFAQGTSANRPKSGTRTQNSLNVIDFDGTNDSLTTTAAKSAFNFLQNSVSTIFRVIKQDSNSGVRFILGTNDGSFSSIGIFQYTSSTNEFARCGGGSGSAVYDISITADTNAKYQAYKSDPANGTAANRIKVSTNAGAFTGTNTGTASTSASNSTIDFILGNDSNGGSLPYDGFIAEILIYDTILSAGDITDVQNYLAGKWAI
jgi:hypothetical protein